ncbi:uncharacterized protein MONBRDRAFT_30201 [Monosiga brevicollis MX1]|uniref:PABS domain-containing protein n=1 Tax=Monosiga brevicollis TaxID=81824 RepID=A9VDA6_MONBE|nr:uncharacterized protein MONBRDRAFT_30201 [Monosiga brevicollis MX1]EDQ84521.1 predicted protein [Monosiga brevicollis MX1]|eukprot:XP_001750708.1 hypothetical protein [Monosiga brevicollis MX1]
MAALTLASRACLNAWLLCLLCTDISFFQAQGPKSALALLTSPNSPHSVQIKAFEETVTADISLSLAAGEAAPDLTDALERVRATATESLKAAPVQHLDATTLYPPVVRGGSFPTVVPSSDGLWIQYDFDELVFHEKSPYQDVKIYHSRQFGNMLLLDDDPNLAESDLAYTQAILGSGRFNFEGKSVLVLGAGDGGVLHQILKLNPANVIMIEIDEVVINAARKHLRGICFDSMDNLTGPNYEIRVKDCLGEMDTLQAQGMQFDYIINDLTAVPVSTSLAGSDWEFLQIVLNRAMPLLAPHGKYLTQGGSANMPAATRCYEDIVHAHPAGLDFTKESVCVPSFHEMWLFYTLWKTN